MLYTGWINRKTAVEKNIVGQDSMYLVMSFLERALWLPSDYSKYPKDTASNIPSRLLPLPKQSSSPNPSRLQPPLLCRPRLPACQLQVD